MKELKGIYAKIKLMLPPGLPSTPLSISDPNQAVKVLSIEFIFVVGHKPHKPLEDVIILQITLEGILILFFILSLFNKILTFLILSFLFIHFVHIVSMLSLCI